MAKKKRGRAPKATTISRKIRRSIKQAGRIDRKALYYASKHKQRYAARHRQENPRPAKFGRWYKGPKGTRVRVSRKGGKIVVDVKK